jgi:IclR family KDG regulon transcriptional repressor
MTATNAANLDQVAQQRVLRRKLQKLTDRSMVYPAEIQARLAIIRERLYEDADGEVMDGVNLLAAVIFRERRASLLDWRDRPEPRHTVAADG